MKPVCFIAILSFVSLFGCGEDASRNRAWTYIEEQETIESSLLTDLRQVRCVGAATI